MSFSSNVYCHNWWLVFKNNTPELGVLSISNSTWNNSLIVLAHDRDETEIVVL